MGKKKVLITGKKQSFLIRVAVKKIQDVVTECEFSTWDIEDINAHWNDVSLVVLYMDDAEMPNDSILHYLVDKMTDSDAYMITVGEKPDVDYIASKVPSSMIYESFYRPIDNENFANSVKELLRKSEAGDFKKRILIIDDDPNYLNVVRGWLKDTYKLSMVSSGLQGIKWLGKNKVDLILLDYEMPITNGPQVLEMLRNDVETASIPVIFLTGRGDKESVMGVVSLKPEGYFLKTIGKNELLTKLKEFFANRKV